MHTIHLPEKTQVAAMQTKKSYGPSDIWINKDLELPSYPFTKVFKGFDRVEAVRRIFGTRTHQVLSRLRVLLYSSRWGGYLWIDDKKGALVVNLHYLKTGRKKYVYLDVIHELVHIKQHMDGRALFDERYGYVDRPTEIEAYKEAVKEAKRIGMSRKEIVDYLKVEWVNSSDFKRLLKAVGLNGKDT